MKSRWSEDDAARCIERYGRGEQPYGEDVALRVYTTRLLGQDPRLVLHGGGNTSVKTRMTDALGDAAEVLCVKGSGWDMGNIEPRGLPAVRLAPLRRLRALSALSDEDMVNFLRTNLLDATAPTPSVEALLHAFVPSRFVDHTHSTAVLALTNQVDGEALTREVYGGRVAIVPYVIPGFLLAKAVASAFDSAPGVEGAVLLNHGLFSFGETAREAYERMIELVTLAEERLARARRALAQRALPRSVASVPEVAPLLRGACAGAAEEPGRVRQRQVLCFRTSPAILEYVGGAEVARYSQQGVVTPDHTIRTKSWPLLVPAPEAGALDAWRAAVGEAVTAFARRYRAFFAENNARVGGQKRELDPLPRVVLVPGVGLFGLGANRAAASIAADIAENTVEVITDAEGLGRFHCLSDADRFDVEYWSLEQAKLSTAPERPLARQVALITGAASGIGLATAQAFAREGAEVALLDLDGARAVAAARSVGAHALGVACDVTSTDSVRAAFDAVSEHFGGVDIVVSNAGAAFQGDIAEVSEETLRASFELNFFAHQRVAQQAVRVMKAQGTGGCLLFNASKQALNPGRAFGPYGLPKATTLFLSKQYALEHGRDGIRSSAVNADRIRSGMLTDAFVAERAAARGVTPEAYLRGNLLGVEVTARDVADAFVFLARAEKTTGAVLTVDGGNIEASVR